jgi:type II secretory pathway predicted ATPase ExeA
MTLRDAIVESKLSYRALARSLGLSKTAFCRIANHSEYPAKRKREMLQQRLRELLAATGITAPIDFWPAQQRQSHGITPETAATRKKLTEEIELMQLDQETLRHFGLRTNPFLNDVEAEEDVFQYKGHVQVTAAIRETIEQRGFLAISAPSGAGKTTIWDGIESEYGLRNDVVLCKTCVKYKEKITPEHLTRALLYGLLGDDVTVQRDAEDRGRQLSSALRALRTGSTERNAVLFIDDAHFCNPSVLRQLKTFYEEKIGRFRLMSIILVGLPQLKAKLSAFPEVGNRIRLVEVPPVPVKDYLTFKLKRVGSSIDKLFEQSGLEAFSARFRGVRGGAFGYPLLINALCIHAMVKCYKDGAQEGERITANTIDQLPGGSAIRRAA